MTSSHDPSQRRGGQRSLLPRVQENLYDASVAVWSSPAGGAVAGGDWCDVLPLSDRFLGVTIGDVSGHGPLVAGTMGVMRAAVLRAMRKSYVPSDVLEIANRVATARCGGVVVTAIVATFDRMSCTLTFANAGHPPPLLLTRNEQRFLQHPPADIPLGVFAGYHAVDFEVTLASDSLAVFYTDGITEHLRDPISGELELVAAARFVHGRRHLDAASAIAEHVLAGGRGDDDAAAIVLRTFSPGS
jgi:serine phosphatase RsbU (regulator of sigma subunit)